MNKEEKHSNKCPICGRLTHKESKYCIFHTGAEEKTEKEFIDALKKYIRDTKEDKIYSFRGFIFIGDINFRNNLNITSFKSVDFRNVVFKKGANFKNTTFEEVANFDSVTFEGVTTFDSAIFKEDTLFCGVTFDEDTDFWRIIFKKHISFKGITFKGDTDFGVTIFERFAMFIDTTFEGNVSFNFVTLPTGNKLNIKVKKKGIICLSKEEAIKIALNALRETGVEKYEIVKAELIFKYLEQAYGRQFPLWQVTIDRLLPLYVGQDGKVYWKLTPSPC